MIVAVRPVVIAVEGTVIPETIVFEFGDGIPTVSIVVNCFMEFWLIKFAEFAVGCVSAFIFLVASVSSVDPMLVWEICVSMIVAIEGL